MAGLASAGGVVVEMMNLSSTADTISNEVDRAAIELLEKYERTEEARKAYLAAEDELNFNIKKTTRTVTDPSCRQPPDPLRPRKPFPGSYQRSSDPNEVWGDRKSVVSGKRGSVSVD